MSAGPDGGGAGWRSLAAIFGIALGLRGLATWWLGPGPFGPDGPGALASATLGGHPYPLHPELMGILGPRWPSILGGALAAASAAAMGRRLGGGTWGPGLAVACAPLALYPSALAGGDALALGIAAAGIALAWSGRPLTGAAVAALSVGAKPIAIPALPLLALAPMFAAGGGRGRFRATAAVAAGAALGALPFAEAWRPLLRPKPQAGLLGTWWLGSGGAPPTASDWPATLWRGLELLAATPWWTALAALGPLSLLAVAWPGSGSTRADRTRRAATLGVGLLAALLTAALIGDRLRPRYLGPALLGPTVLAGCALRRAPWAALGLLWPSLALVSQVAALRATEEALPARPLVPGPPIEAAPLYEDAAVCGADDLRALATALAASLPVGAEVAALRLRDGREGELLWPLRAARPDLLATTLHRGCCPDPGACLETLERHLAAGGVLIAPRPDAPCETQLLDFNERELAAALADRLGDSGRVYGRWEPAAASATPPDKGRRLSACEALQGPPGLRPGAGQAPGQGRGPQ